jgi:hypothetical protein
MAMITLINKQNKSTGLIILFPEALSQGTRVNQAFGALDVAANISALEINWLGMYFQKKFQSHRC